MEQAAGGGDGGDARHPPVLQNENPNFLTEGYYTVIWFLQSYGWFLVIGIVAAMFAWSRLEPTLQKWRKKREEREYEDFDANVAMARQSALEAARQRMQEEHEAKAARFAEEQKRREEERRQQKIEEWERHKEGKGYHSKHRTQDGAASASGGQSEPRPKSKKNTYKPADYNPLVGGASGGACFRPSRRGGGGGGG